MQNIFTQGSQGIMINGKLYHLLCNEDYCVIGEITAFESGIISFKKVWDKAASQEIFEAAAKLTGKSGVPSRFDVGACMPFSRAELESKDFVGFANESLHFSHGIPALLSGPASFSRVDYSNDVNTALSLNSADCWQQTDLQRITNYKVYDRDSEAIQIIATDSAPVMVRKGDSLTHFRDTVTDCTGGLATNKVYRADIAPARLNFVTKAWCVDNVAAIAPGVECCSVANSMSATIKCQKYATSSSWYPYLDLNHDCSYYNYGPSFTGSCHGWFGMVGSISSQSVYFYVDNGVAIGWRIRASDGGSYTKYYKKDVNPTDPDEPNGQYTFESGQYQPSGWRTTLQVSEGWVTCT